MRAGRVIGQRDRSLLGDRRGDPLATVIQRVAVAPALSARIEVQIIVINGRARRLVAGPNNRSIDIADTHFLNDNAASLDTGDYG